MVALRISGLLCIQQVGHGKMLSSFKLPRVEVSSHIMRGSTVVLTQQEQGRDSQGCRQRRQERFENCHDRELRAKKVLREDWNSLGREGN